MNGRLGRYLLLSRLGAGGTAEVWRARLDGPNGFERDVVLKRLRPELAADAAFVSRMRSEARLVARLNHPNVVQVYELFEASGETVLVMEHVSGCDLLELLRAHALLGTKLPVGMAAYIAREVARGLAAAHGHHDDAGRPMPIVHRDVNPANIMLGADGSVKLIDFGFAKAAEARTRELTATGVLFGKQGYLAPEQLADVGRRTEPDPRSDQFSLGVVLHEMLSGHRFALQAATRDASWSSVSESPALDRIWRQMTSVDPAARYAECVLAVEQLDDVTRELAFGAAQAAAHLIALGVVRISSATPDGGRETEDAGVGLLGDTVVETAPRFVVRMRSRAKTYAASLLLAAAAAAIFVVSRRPRAPAPPLVAKTPAPAPPEPALTTTTPAPVEVIPEMRPRAKSVRTAPHPATRAHRSPSVHTAPPPQPVDGRVQDGTIYDPFKK